MGTLTGFMAGGPAGAAVGGLFDLAGIGLAYGLAGDDESKYEEYRADLVRRERDYASQDKLIGRREWLQAQRKRASEGMPKQVKEAQTLAALIGQSAIEAGPPVRDADEVLADLPAAVRGDFSGMDDEDHEDFWTVLQRKRDTDPYAGGDPYASALYYAGVEVPSEGELPGTPMELRADVFRHHLQWEPTDMAVEIGSYLLHDMMGIPKGVARGIVRYGGKIFHANRMTNRAMKRIANDERLNNEIFGGEGPRYA
jgi:hypothetical protein